MKIFSSSTGELFRELNYYSLFYSVVFFDGHEFYLLYNTHSKHTHTHTQDHKK